MASVMYRLMSVVLLLTWLYGIEAVMQRKTNVGVASNDPNKVHIVYMGGVGTGTSTNTEIFHTQMLSQVLGSAAAASSSILYSYTTSFNGFAAVFSETHAEMIKGMDGVVSVFESQTRQLHTTDSWEYLGLNPTQGVWLGSNFGNDSIVGMVDTGIWPESESFKDDGMGPIPSRWNGSCETGDNFTLANCNKKLIGAKFFAKGFQFFENITYPEYLSPRDAAGHGSHTSSTAAGRRVANASFDGVANGTATGGASLARLAMYKACWYESCTDADLLAAMNAAIADGVDVMSLSIGGQFAREYSVDSIAIGAFHAVEKGIIVSCSAGNGGAGGYGTAVNTAPWIFTVAASTQNRVLESKVEIPTPKGRYSFSGIAINSFTMNASYPLIYIASPFTATQNQTYGKVVAVNSTSIFPDDTLYKELGAVGVIAISDIDQSVQWEPILPYTNLNSSSGSVVMELINSTKNPVAIIDKSQSVYNTTQAPVMAWFSSIGPNIVTPQILKPDITAPGVDILAAWAPVVSPSSSDRSLDPRVTKFNIISGTSMSCPHVAGTAALVKSIHPHWTQASIKSAIMTTATPLLPLSPFSKFGNESVAGNSMIASGSGQINPAKAADPGLVFNMTTFDYLDFLCAIGYNSSTIHLMSGGKYKCPKNPTKVLDMNYPSIYLGNNVTVGVSYNITRTVTNVGPVSGPVAYTAVVTAPNDFDVKVSPSILHFSDINTEMSFTVTVTVRTAIRKYAFGSIAWTDGGAHKVSIPIGGGPPLFGGPFGG